MDWTTLPQGAQTFVLSVRLAMTTRRPCRDVAETLEPDQRLHLVAEPDNVHDPCAVSLVTDDGRVAGYLYAETAAWMSLLLCQPQSMQDESRVISILRRGDDPQAMQKRRRHPIVTVRLQLQLSQAWPLYTLAAVIGFRSEDFEKRFNLPGNPFLQPLRCGYRQHQALGCDRFVLPGSISRAWMSLVRSPCPCAPDDLR